METIFIKNMVCDRCISSVKRILENHQIEFSRITLGEAVVQDNIPPNVLATIENELRSEGFEIIDNTQPVLVSKIKSALVQLFNDGDIRDDFKLSVFLTKKFPYAYSHLSRLFSQHEKNTIEQFLIKLRIEKAKELLTYNDHNVSEVAYKLGYTSNAHFSRQFKKLVGVSPSVYKQNPVDRKSLGDL